MSDSRVDQHFYSSSFDGDSPRYPPQHQRVNPTPTTTISTIDTWRPKKLLGYGDKQMLAAKSLLTFYGAKLDPPRHLQAQSLLQNTDDVRCTLNNKCLLAQISPARLYVKKASEALDKIKTWLDPMDFGPLEANQQSTKCDEFDLRDPFGDS